MSDLSQVGSGGQGGYGAGEHLLDRDHPGRSDGQGRPLRGHPFVRAFPVGDPRPGGVPVPPQQTAPPAYTPGHGYGHPQAYGYGRPQGYGHGHPQAYGWGYGPTVPQPAYTPQEPYTPQPAYTPQPSYAPQTPYAPQSPYHPPQAPPPAPVPHPPPRDRHEPDELSEATGAGAADELILGTFRPLREPDPPPRRRQPAHRAPSGRRRAPSTTRAPDAGLRRLVPQALVIAVLAGGTAAFVAGDKAVRLTVDGRTRTLHTFADDVGELLADAGVGTGAHDRVSPATTAELTSGDAVEVRYGRPLSLTLDGRRRTLWTTARTVGDALRLLAVPTAGARLSAPGSRPIPRSGLALDVRTERTVTFRADGRTHSVRTHALTVGQALSEAGILLRDEDTTSVPLDAFPRDGQNVSVLRISGAREVREESIPYEVVRVADPGLAAGTETVAQQGVPGVRRVTYELRTVDGVRREPRRIADVVVRPPVTHRVHVGTRNAPVRARTAGTGSGGSGGSDGLDWQALAHCESGGRAGAVDSSGTHGGLYQFDQGTWHSTGGSGRPQDASAAEQTYRAKRLYARRGAAPWPHCGRRLFR